MATAAIGGLGSLIGGVGGLLSALGGSGAKTDRKQQLAGYGDLSSIFNYGMGAGKAETGAGEGTLSSSLDQLGPAAAYYRQLLTGGRQGAMAAAAPTVNAANAQGDAAQRQVASEGTARGGGVNAAGQQLETAKMSTVDNAIAQQRAGAAQGATNVANATTSVGGQQLNAALRLLGLGNEAATNLTSIAGGSRGESQAIHNNQAGQIGQSVGTLLFGQGANAPGLFNLPGGGGGG